MTQEKDTQKKAILRHLQSGKELSQLEATQKYGVLRLGAIIFELRKEGYIISTRLVRDPNRYGNASNYGVYKLIEEKKEVCSI